MDYTRVVSFTLEALELEMQSGIIVQQAEALELEKSYFLYSEGSRTRFAIRYYISNWRRIVSFTLEALKLGRVVSFTLKALELEMQSSIIS